MSLNQTAALAAPCDVPAWADLTAGEKRDAVRRHLVAGRNLAETARLLSVTYGPVGQNHVSGVIDRHRLMDDADVKRARQQRGGMERAANLARARALKPKPVTREPLPAIDPPRLGDPRKKARVTIWDLKTWQCPRPLWDDSETRLEERFYCGNRKEEGGDWCAACRPIVYAPPQARRVSSKTVYQAPKQGRYLRWK